MTTRKPKPLPSVSMYKAGHEPGFKVGDIAYDLGGNMIKVLAPPKGRGKYQVSDGTFLRFLSPSAIFISKKAAHASMVDREARQARRAAK